MILFEGNSRIDGKPIVAIATIGSKNVKTGDMVQVWILRADVAPHIAIKGGQDRSVCGDCPQRQYTGGACYVITHQAPLSVWNTYKKGVYTDPKHIARVSLELRTKPIRLGAYGDPCAVPLHIWEELLAQGCQRWTGYTHQWGKGQNQSYRGLLMASADSPQQAEQARRMGWRFFLVTDKSVTTSRLPGQVVECLSDSKGMSCADCSVCDGTRADSRSPTAASVAITVHGTFSKRFLPVIPATR